jgi:2-polyprenyl-3-methyl-5-hydroxy-6-metoxy-1,4-benzoquinol methylase
MALSKALEKLKHKQAWYTRGRNTIEEKMQFYQEVDIYLFRQPYNKRFGGFRWYRNLVTHIERPAILEYGCGSAVLTEYLIERFPNLKYTVADILSNTLDFVRWKKERYGYQYNILNIGAGKQGIPLSDPYDLIICQDVLEHTPNPLEIVTSFVEHLSSEGVLVVDFINAPGGENLDEAAEQRESVKAYLRENLIPIKAIDEPQGNNGLYVKNSD